MNAVAKINTPFRVGQWLPSDHEILKNWLEELIQELGLKGEQSLHPVIQKFKDFIENDAEVYMLFSLMFTQVNHKKDPAGDPQVKNYLQMLQLLNAIMTRTPKYARNGLVGHSRINLHQSRQPLYRLDVLYGRRHGRSLHLRDHSL